MRNEKVADLPGVGWSLAAKLEEMDITTCGDLRKIPKLSLQVVCAVIVPPAWIFSVEP